MATQHDAAKLYTELQETAAANEAWQQCADADWYRRHPEERAGRIGVLQAAADAETRHAMGAVAVGIWAVLFLAGLAIFAGGMLLMGVTHIFWLGAISVPGGVMVAWCLRQAVRMGSVK